jgi:predicted aspartyl protease
MLRRDCLLGAAGLLSLAFPAFADTQSKVWVEGPGTAVIPLRHAADGKVYFTAQVLDRDTVLFVDTGATSIFDVTLLRARNVPLTDMGQTGYGLSGAVGSRMQAIVDIQLGKLKITGWPADCIDLSGLKAVNKANGLPEFDGLIGSDLLSFLKATVDFDRLTLTLRRPH